LQVRPHASALPARDDRVRKITGADVVQRNPWNLSGAGVNLGIWDEADVDHSDFAGRLTNMQSLGAANTPHVAGTMAGDGAAGRTLRGRGAGARKFSPGTVKIRWPTWPAKFRQQRRLDQQQLDLLDRGSAGELHGAEHLRQFTAAYDEFARGSYGQVVGIVFAAGNMADNVDCGIVKRGGYESLPPRARRKT
jgi:hypothetical protein